MWEFLVFFIILILFGILDSSSKKKHKPKQKWEPKPDKEEYSEMLRSTEWRITRKRILERDNHKCRLCGADHRFMQVHHTAYYGYHPSDTSDEYLLTLCKKCHTDVHNTAQHQFLIRDMVHEAVEAAEAARGNAIMGEEEARLEMERFQREHTAALKELRAKHKQTQL